jgi:hypothetical protein
LKAELSRLHKTKKPFTRRERFILLDVVPPGLGFASSFGKPLLQMQKSSLALGFFVLFAYLKKRAFFVALQNKKPFHKVKGFLRLMWCLQESNQGHKDFQSFALPTELRHPTLILFSIKPNLEAAKILILSVLQNFSKKILIKILLYFNPLSLTE